MRFETPRHEALWTLVEPLLPTVDIAHDRYHVERVYRWAVRLAREAGADVDLVGGAALVHDLVHVPKDHADRAAASERSAREAAPWLERAGYAPEEVQQMVGAVTSCSWSRGQAPDSLLAAVLQDADRLDALGALGMLRTASTAQAMSRPGAEGRYYDPDDPAGRSGRPLDDRRQALDHLPIKLLRLADGMHLPSARAEAQRRHAFLLAFLDEIEHEVRAQDEGL